MIPNLIRVIRVIRGFLGVYELPVMATRIFSFDKALGFRQERYVDAAGTPQLFTTDCRLPGLFYLHYQWVESRLLTFALRGWLLLGLSGLLPGLSCLFWISRKRNRISTEPKDRQMLSESAAGVSSEKPSS